MIDDIRFSSDDLRRRNKCDRDLGEYDVFFFLRVTCVRLMMMTRGRTVWTAKTTCFDRDRDSPNNVDDNNYCYHYYCRRRHHPREHYGWTINCNGRDRHTSSDERITTYNTNRYYFPNGPLSSAPERANNTRSSCEFGCPVAPQVRGECI